MSFEHEERSAAHLLSAIEDGAPALADVRPLFEDADPALIYLLFAWLRARYHPSHPAAEGVLGRIVALCTMSPKVAKKARAGEKDPVVAWFEEAYEYREVERDQFISMIVEKLEG